jgi:hypothetical protein
MGEYSHVHALGSLDEAFYGLLRPDLPGGLHGVTDEELRDAVRAREVDDGTDGVVISEDVNLGTKLPRQFEISYRSPPARGDSDSGRST